MAGLDPGPLVAPVPGGAEWRRGRFVMRVVALRDDVLRVRIGRSRALPEDASWAVLPEARLQHVAVTHEPGGFSTATVRVRIDAFAGTLAVADLEGRMILEDAADAPFSESEPSSGGNGHGFTITKALPAETSIFGLGEKAGQLDRRGRSFVMWNTDAYRYQESSEPLYKDIPFFVGFERGRAYGLFLDNTFRSRFEFGVRHPDRLSFGADGGAIDYYIMAGPTPADVQRGYAWLTGPPPLPPLWSFGYQQCRFTYMSQAEAMMVAHRMRAERMPCDVIWFDIDVLEGHRAFSINKQAYPDFPGMVEELGRLGYRAIVITDLHVARLQGAGYVPWDGGSAGNHFVHDAEGGVYIGKVWPGDCAFPDFTRKATRDWWGTLLRSEVLVDHVAGIWNDMNEPSVFGTPTRTMPLDNVHRIEEPGFATRTASHREIHNVFGMQNARATYDGMLAARSDRRPYVMSRATYAGGQRTSVVWTGDNSGTWNHLRMSTPMLLGLGLGGFAFAGCDLGGFAGSAPPDLLTRWFQLGMFNPIARGHADKGSRHREPYVDGEPHSSIRRHAIEERYRLLPYIYTVAEEASRTGMPMMRPLFMEFPEAAGGYALDLEGGNQFMWGGALLVAPAPYPEEVDRYQVILPPGDWYDYWTGARIANPAPATLTGGSGSTAEAGDDPEQMPHRVDRTPQLDRLPVFVRAGSIIARQPLVQSTSETPQGPLELAIYPGPNCQGAVYIDDGLSFAYRDGSYLRVHHRCHREQDGTMIVSLGRHDGTFRPWWTRLEVAIHDASAPAGPVTLDGAVVTDLRYDAAARLLRLGIPDQSSGGRLVLPAHGGGKPP